MFVKSFSIYLCGGGSGGGDYSSKDKQMFIQSKTFVNNLITLKSYMIDKVYILNELKRHKKFKTNAEFARFLQITPQNLANWYKRNTFDVNLLANLFTDVNKSWLLTGEGEMLKNNTSISGDITNNRGNINHVVGNGNKVATSSEIIESSDFQRLMDIMEKQGEQANARLMESQAQVSRLLELLSKQ